jgi:alpha-N-acetylglucosaminidase
MDQLIHNFYAAREQFGAHMKGWGLTMEGIETNPVMYELTSELPWRSQQIDKE